MCVHEGRKDHLCGKFFSQKSYVKLHMKRQHNQATLSEQLENIAEYCNFESENSWAKTNIKKECVTEKGAEITSTECVENYSKIIKIKEEEKIKIEMKEEEIILKDETPENLSSDDFNFLCENDLELDQIPIYD